MLTREENETLTRVGRGTPGGELLRRYWMPVACAGELTEEKPIKAFRLLGENLVVYRDKSGRYGSSPNSARTAKRHWRLAASTKKAFAARIMVGNSTALVSVSNSRPSLNPAASKTKSNTLHIHVSAWAVCFGLISVRSRGRCCRVGTCWPGSAANAGSRSTKFITATGSNRWKTPSTRRIFIGSMARPRIWCGVVGKYEEEHNFIPFEYGIIKQRRTPGRKPGEGLQMDQHPLLFPITLRHVFRALKTTGWLMHNVQIRVPVDDAHTQVFVVYFTPNETDISPADGDTPWEYFPIRDEKGEYRLDHVLVQDAMAWESQGAPTDRTQEHLGVGDEGIILLRKLLREQIDIVQKGGEPLGLVRDPSKNQIIEFDVVNERVGLFGKQQKVA